MRGDHEVRLVIKVRAVFWKEDDQWHGQCIEVDASSVGETFREADRALHGAAYAAAYRELQGGRLPVRDIASVDSSLVDRWTSVRQRGGQHEISKLCQHTDSAFKEIATTVSLDLFRTVANAEEDPGLGPISVLLLEDGDLWAAQCLEFDLGGQGATQEEAAAALSRHLLAQVTVDRMLGKEPLADILRAPERYWELYKQAAHVAAPSQRHMVIRAA